MTPGARRTLSLDAAVAPQSLGLVLPSRIYAAGSREFDVRVAGTPTAESARHTVFAALPLTDAGWEFRKVKIYHLYDTALGRVFRMARGDQ